MKTLIITAEEYSLLCKCANFASYIFDSLLSIDIDLAKATSKYIALNTFLYELRPVVYDNGKVGYILSEEYFETSVDVIQLAISHLSWDKCRDIIQSLYGIKNKIKKEGK